MKLPFFPPPGPSSPPGFSGLGGALRLFFLEHKRSTGWMIFFYVLKQSPGWGLPLMIAQVIDLTSADPVRRVQWLLIYGAILCLWILQNHFTHSLFVSHQSRICRTVCMELRMKLCLALQQLSILYHDRTSIGRLESKLIRDIEVIETVPHLLTEVTLSAGVNVLVAFVAILIKAPVALLSFVILVPVSVLLQRRFSKVIHEQARLYQSSIENMNARVHSMITMIPVTKAHGLETAELNLVHDKIAEVARRGEEFDMVNARFGSSGWVTFMLFQVVFLIGSTYLNFIGKITIGDIVMFNSFFASLSASFNALLNLFPNLSKVRESMHSISEILEAPDRELNQGKIKVTRLEGAFEFQNVSFHYPGTVRPAVSDISFTVRPKQSIAFVGPSGCGKSTLLYLVLGFIRPQSGKISLDGKEMNSLDLQSFRNNIGIVTQDIILSHGSIRDNISYGLNNTGDDQVREALKLANALEFVEKLPKGMHTMLGEKGINLSRGQKQRLAIARALIRSPKVLILDEATSALDVESERLVQESLEQFIRRQTTFIVTHRLATVRNVDLIAVMDSGKIVQLGAHDQLLQSGNFYSRGIVRA